MRNPMVLALIATVLAALAASVGASADTPLTLAGSNYSGSGSGTSISTSCALGGSSTMSVVSSQTNDTGGGLGSVDWQMSQSLTVGAQTGLPHAQPTGQIVSLDSFSMHLSGASGSATVTVQPPYLGRPAHTNPAATCWDFQHQDFSSHEIRNFSFYVDHYGVDDTNLNGYMHSADYYVPYQAAIFPTSGAAILESGYLHFSCDDESFSIGVGFGGCFLSFNAQSQQPLDSAPPTVTGGPDRPANANGWYSSNVTIDWQAADPAPSSGTPTDPPDTVASTEGTNVLYTSAPSCDPAGNCATGSLALSVDKTPPAVACNAASFLVNQPGANVSASVTDALSGPAAASVSVPVGTAAAGTFTTALTGYDKAGNATTMSCPYTVGYRFAGFQQPIDNEPTVNMANAGKTIPVKWQITDYNGVAISDPASFVSVTSGSTTCSASDPPDAVETYSGNSRLQYLGNGNWQFNWATPKGYAGLCRVMHLNLADGGTNRIASFKFK